jgi:hypothetical protein
VFIIYDGTVLSIDSVILLYAVSPQLLERACAFFCLQEWSAGIKDLTFVLVFVPTHIKALLMRYEALSLPLSRV